ncbi:MAG: SusC/RagA family TonB-linked outer membrane protein [Bacteroidota bacterium]
MQLFAKKQILLMMKLTATLMLIACLTASARTSAQVNLTEKKASLEKVLQLIKKQSGYTLFYDYELVKQKGKPVDIEVKNVPVEQALHQVFLNQILTYEITGTTILIKEKEIPKNADPAISGTPPPIDIHGIVKDETGKPAQGVAVKVKGTNKGTVTNDNGEFVLTGIDVNATLEFSAVNLQAFELKINGKNELAVTLKNKISELADVSITSVNTGYQQIPKERATGSFVQIDNKTLNEQVGTNILSRLNGVTSGLYFNVGKSNSNPQNTTNISIRGLSTINGPLDPLIILDNFIYEGSINNINPNDIESVTVLKDAAATSIWGARAGNGVIVLTTKKGRFNQKNKVEFNTDIIIAGKPDLYYLPQISSSDYIDIEQNIFNQGYFNSQISNTSNRPALTPAVEVFLKRKSGLISASDSATQINALKAIDSRAQYDKYFYQQAITQQYSLNLRGGSNNIAWLLSGNFDRTVGSLKDQFNKINLRFNNSYRVTKNLTVDAGVYYTNNKATSGMTNPSTITINNRQVPYLSFADANGNDLAISKYRNGYIDTVGAGHLLDWHYYPLQDWKHNVSTTTSQELVANLGINYQIINSLKLNVNYQYQRQWGTNQTLSDLQSFYARDLINNFSQINYSTGSVNYIIPTGNILRYSYSDLSIQNLREQLNFDKVWGQHSISAIVGNEIREVINSGNSVGYYGYNSDPLSFGAVDFRNTYKTIIPANFQNIPNSPVVLPTTDYRFVSLYTNFAYTYKQRYILSGSLRKDASNTFGLNTNDKWNPLWSAGIAWDITKEKFYNFSGFSYLKLRTSLGYSGNVDVNKTPLPIASSGSSNPITNFPYQLISTINNPSLRWEKSKQWNIGIDFATKRQRILGSIDYYNKKGTDLYGQIALDYTAFGLSNQVTKNVASMEGQGIDISILSKNIDRTFKWTTNFLFNYNTSKTSAYYTPAANTAYTLLQGGNSIYPVIGYPLYSIAAYKWGGLNSVGDPQGYLQGKLSTDYNSITQSANKYGLDSGQIVYIGPSNPTIFGSLINEFSYKGFSISFNISYSLGYYFRKPSFTSNALINNGYGYGEYSQRWQKSGDELVTNVPAFVYTNYPQFSARDNFYQFSQINVLKADNIKLQYINLGYSFDGSKVRLPFERLQVYFNAANLGIIWRANKYGIDPDYPSSFPPSKTFAFGIKAIF